MCRCLRQAFHLDPQVCGLEVDSVVSVIRLERRRVAEQDPPPAEELVLGRILFHPLADCEDEGLRWPDQKKPVAGRQLLSHKLTAEAPCD